jgi:hypothetical protein
MTELYQIPLDASLEAVRRALGQWRNRRVALALPEGWLELNNVARMRLLQRQAQIQHNEIAVITREPATRAAAKQVGVPVFNRAEQAAGDRWRMDPLLPLIDPRHPEAGLPEPPPWRRQEIVARQSMPTQRQARQRRIKSETAYRKPTPAWMRIAGNLVMGLLIVAALAGFTYYVLPAATITLTPGHLPLQTDLAMTAIAGLEAADGRQAQLPARLVKAELLEQGAVPATGTSQKASGNAVGEVVFSNLSSAPVTIPINTLVSTSSGTPVQFRTLREASVEGGVGQRVSVPVEAAEPGIAGNVRANTINTVVGALRFRLRVNNTNGTGGGGAELVSVVSQQDREQLVTILQGAAEAKAYDALLAQLEPGEWLPPESVQTFVVAQSFDQYSDEEAQQLSGSVRVLAQGLAVNEAGGHRHYLFQAPGTGTRTRAPGARQRARPAPARKRIDHQLRHLHDDRLSGLYDADRPGRGARRRCRYGARHSGAGDPGSLVGRRCAGDLSRPSVERCAAQLAEPHPGAR